MSDPRAPQDHRPPVGNHPSSQPSSEPNFGNHMMSLPYHRGVSSTSYHRDMMNSSRHAIPPINLFHNQVRVHFYLIFFVYIYIY